MPTLLEKAQKSKRTPLYHKEIDDQTIELSFAYLKDEVSITQIGIALEKGNGHTQASYCMVARSLLLAYRQGRLKIVDPK